MIQRAFGPTVKTAAIAAAESALNRALTLDPASRQQLAALHGQIFHLECTRPALDIFLILHANRIQLAGHWEGDITAGVSGSADDYTELLTSRDPGATLINGAMTVRGDSKALLRLRDIAANLDIDWEAPLTQLFGDIIGHQLANTMRATHRIVHHAVLSFARQLRDYVQEESDWLAPRWQVEQFRADVAQVAQRGEQLAERIARLQQQVAQRAKR